MTLWMQSEDAKIACGAESLPKKITKSLIGICFPIKILWFATSGKEKFGVKTFAAILIRGRVRRGNNRTRKNLSGLHLSAMPLCVCGV